MNKPRKSAVFFTLTFGVALAVAVLLFVGSVCSAFFGWEGAIWADILLIGAVVSRNIQIERSTRPTLGR